MKRTIIALLALFTLLIAGRAMPASAEEHPAASRFASCSTVITLLRAADAELRAGTDPALVYDEMSSAAAEKGFLRELRFAMENTAAYGTERYQKAAAVAGAQDRDPGLGDSVFRSWWYNIGFDPYGYYEDASDAFLNMIADPEARYCLEAGIWTEADFERVHGTSFAKFRPARPRAGYVCIVIKNGAQSGPETAWYAEENPGSNGSFLFHLRKTVANMISHISEPGMSPIFTGNPDTASSFWLFDLRYPFYAWYGHNNIKEVRGFNCSISMTVFDAATHKTTAKLASANRLGRKIDTWHNWIANADVPDLADKNGFASFVSKVEKAIAKQYAAEDTSARILAVNAQSALNGLLAEQAENSSDAWLAAICAAGAQDVRFDTDAVSFSLRSFDPRLKELGAYAKAADGSAWLQAALENASAFDLRLTLPLENGRLTKTARISLSSTLKKAAATASAGFGGKDMAAALADRFFPAPFEGKITAVADLLSPSSAFLQWYDARGLADTGLSAREMAIVCYAQKKQALSVKAGPSQLQLTCTGSEPAEMLASCTKALLDEIAYMPADTRASTDGIEAALSNKLAEAAITAHAKAASTCTFTLSLDELAEGKNPEEYLALLAKFDIRAAAASLRATAESLPAATALPLPKTGRLTSWSSDKSGTKVTFALFQDSNPAYLVVRTAEENRRYVSAFLHPGQKLTLLLPAGFYRFALCTGQWWYGEEELFSTQGSYWLSESTQILGPKYTHTFSLNPADEYELLFEPASPEDFT